MPAYLAKRETNLVSSVLIIRTLLLSNALSSRQIINIPTTSFN
jgi:hypothetical protein